MQLNSMKPERQVISIREHSRILEISASPIWVYDSGTSSNVWGNRAALELFQVDAAAFTRSQTSSNSWSSEQLRLWTMLNAQLHQDVEVAHKEVTMTVTGREPIPSFLPIASPQTLMLKAIYKPLALKHEHGEQDVTLVQVIQQNTMDVEDNHLRMVEMCNNHPMFQFLFDENGMLLTANKQAMYNMREHLGSQENYNLHMYLSIGECDGISGPDDMYRTAMKAIFVDNAHCHRFPQLRWSKRHPGKFRWVLYEMWPLDDPVSHKRAVLVCEQNISQVKALEDQFQRRNKRLEAQLEEALAQRDRDHMPAIDIDTPADKTLKLLDKIMNGDQVTKKDALELRNAILRAGDLRQPVNFNEQLMQRAHSVLDADVSQSLIQLLSTRPTKISEVDQPSTSTEKSPHPHIHTPTTPVTAAGVQGVIQLTKNMPYELNSELAGADGWEFNAFKLSEASKGRPLSVLSFALLRRSEAFNKFDMDEEKLVKFLIRIENGYPSNPYHNRIHAADVLQTLHALIVRGGLRQQGYCDDLGVFACYLAAIIHDYEHRGVNNDYLVRVSDPLAILYNDRSPMENHHLAAAFSLMNSADFNFLSNVPQAQRENMRKLIIDLVLATDMKQHFAIHSMFQSKLQIGSRSGGGGSSDDSGSSNSGIMHIDDDHKSLVLQTALKCADLGHLACPRDVHKQWVHYLEEEFFMQGDREKQKQLVVSPLMDRCKNGISMSQVGFFDIVALPLFQSFTHAFPETQPMLDAVKDNYSMWREVQAKAKGSW